MKKIHLLFCLVLFFACQRSSNNEEPQTPVEPFPFTWENANVYFMLTDRFNNGDTTNDLAYGRKANGAPLRSFMGGDIRGVIQKLDEGYFEDLGITAIWMNPIVENIHGAVDEGTGLSYGFHGYWARDWTTLDKNFGTMADYQELVDKAHAKGIRIIMDVVINHTGPVTEEDSQWPASWVRTGPQCDYQDYENTVSCTLVENLPDIRTAKEEEVELPEFLLAKWEKEGRLEEELKELEAFFVETGYPRAPKYYIIKWLVDYVRELGIDGFRVDTAKHTEAGLWAELYREAMKAFEDWKEKNPDKKLDENDFYMVGEVYGYSLYDKQNYNYGDTTVNFFAQDFDQLISFSMKSEWKDKSHEELFSTYSDILNSPEMEGISVLNYLSSHDDHNPPVALREDPFTSAEFLLLAPGASQIYYGDETARILEVEEAEGDAKLRSFMNWDELETNSERGQGYRIQDIRNYWAKLGQFRRNHPAIGAGVHQMIAESPYTFKRTYETEGRSDVVVVAMGDSSDEIDVSSAFEDGIKVRNTFTGEQVSVSDGKVIFTKKGKIYLIEKA